MAIRLNIRPTTCDLRGQSHWWGAPDLPEGVPYPYVTVGQGTDDPYDEPLTFVCQLLCSDLAPFDPEGLLPREGMLWIFAPLDYYLGDLDAPLDHHTPPVVLYSRDMSHLQPYEIYWEGTDESVFRPAEEIWFESTPCQTGDGMLLLGRPYQTEVHEAHANEVCLLQIDEEDRWGLRFVDCGMYYLFISPERLRQLDFSVIGHELFYY